MATFWNTYVKIVCSIVVADMSGNSIRLDEIFLFLSFLSRSDGTNN